ncbi:MAG: DUF4296 domain-containing protein [Flavobacterium sp.]
MKKIAILFLMFSVFASCQKSAIEKPDKLIDEDVMVEIIYDLAILEAIKSQNLTPLETHSINSNDYIYKKYKIDSLQFAKNDKYYASDIKKYKSIYDRVSKKIEEKLAVPDTTKKAKSNSDQEIVL